MQHFTARPSGWQVAKRSWASLRDGARGMKLLFITSMILGALVSGAVFASPHVTNLLIASKKALPADMIWPAIGARFARIFVGAMIAAPVAVAMHRFVLLDEVKRGPIWWGRRRLIFVAWIAGLQLVFAAMAAAPLLMPENAPEGMLIFCSRIAFAMFCIYLLMLFPAVAIDVPSPSFSMRLETSMEQTIGRFWFLVWAMVLTLLPLVALQFLVGFPLAAVTKAAQTALVAKPKPPVIVAAALLGALNIIVVAQVAAVLSWLYSWFSRGPAAKRSTTSSSVAVSG